MRLKTYNAMTMAEAMRQVRRELGEEAIIVATRSGPGRRGVCIQAAIEEPDPDDAEPFPFPRQDLGPDLAPDLGPDPGQDWATDVPEAAAIRGIRDALSFHGLPGWLRDRLLRVSGEQHGIEADDRLAIAIAETIAFDALDEARVRRPLMFVGVPGVGKTIATAKSILRAQRAGRTVAAITTDGRRAGAYQQLEAFTRILGVPLQAAETPKALAAAVRTGADHLTIIDTAGVNPLSDPDFNELAGLVRAAEAEPIVIVPAGGDALDTAESAQSFAALGAKRLLATKMDLSRRYGAPFVAAATARLAVAGAGISADIADGFKPVTPQSAARLLLPTDLPSPRSAHPKTKEPAL